jgi:lysyl endopeptidase
MDGAIAPGSWLPAPPDGTSLGPMPASLRQRYVDLNQRFADAWRVSGWSSLFDYEPGTTTKTFADQGWPPGNPLCLIPGSSIAPAEPMELANAEELCGSIEARACARPHKSQAVRGAIWATSARLLSCRSTRPT